MAAKPPDHLRRRQVVLPPASRQGPPPKPSKLRFTPSEAPTAPQANINAARWRMISRALPDLDGKALAILETVAAALAEMPPTEPVDLIRRYDAMNERQRRVLAAVVHALAAGS